MVAHGLLGLATKHATVDCVGAQVGMAWALPSMPRHLCAVGCVGAQHDTERAVLGHSMTRRGAALRRRLTWRGAALGRSRARHGRCPACQAWGCVGAQQGTAWALPSVPMHLVVHGLIPCCVQRMAVRGMGRGEAWCGAARAKAYRHRRAGAHED